MLEVFFYHFIDTSVVDGAVDLISRSLKKGWRSLVRFQHDEKMAAISEMLWQQKLPVPNALATQDFPEEQVVLFTKENVNLNKADICFLLEGSEFSDILYHDSFKRLAILFDGRDWLQLKKAREQWKSFLGEGVEPSYFKQDTRGKWSLVGKV